MTPVVSMVEAPPLDLALHPATAMAPEMTMPRLGLTAVPAEMEEALVALAALAVLVVLMSRSSRRS